MKIYSIILLSMLLVSCASNNKVLLNSIVPESQVQTGLVYDDNLELEVSFIGIIADRYVFETVLTNSLPHDIVVDRSHFFMRHQGVSTLHTEDLYQTITEIEEDQKKRTKRRKANNVLNGISVGIGLLSGITAGASASSTILSSVESTLYVVDESIWITKDIQSSEDYIAYLKKAQYDYDVVTPGATLTRDVFFDVIDINSEVEIEFRIEDLLYSVSFPQTAFEY